MEWASQFDLNFTASFYHVTITNTNGEVTEVKTFYKSVKCAFWMLSASEVFANDRIKNPSTHKIAFAPTTGILPSDRVVINSVEYRMDVADDILGMGDMMTIGLYLEG